MASHLRFGSIIDRAMCYFFLTFNKKKLRSRKAHLESTTPGLLKISAQIASSSPFHLSVPFPLFISVLKFSEEERNVREGEQKLSVKEHCVERTLKVNCNL